MKRKNKFINSNGVTYSKSTNKTILSGALILIIFNLICKAIGAVYRIPLARILGGEGIGQYQLVFPLYSLILTVSSSGIPVAISKMVAEFNARREYKNARNLLYIALLILTLLSCLGFIFISAFATNIAKIQGNPEIYICYYALAPAILFVGVISAFRGFFQGNLNMIPTAISNFVEQVFKLFFGLFLANLFIKNGVIYAVFGALLGVSISEFFSFIFLLFYYIFHLKIQAKKSGVIETISTENRDGLSKGIINNSSKIINGKILSYNDLSKRLIRISVPVTLSGLITPITAILDSFLVINLLMISGFSSDVSTSLLGIESGVVEPLIHLPVVIAISLSTVILPSISSLSETEKIAEKGLSLRHNKKVALLVKNSLQVSLSIAIAFVIGYVVFGSQILRFLYSKTFSNSELLVSTKLLFLASFNIIFLSLVQVTAGTLQGLGAVKYSVKTLLIGCGLKVIFEIVLVQMKQVNIYGVVLSALVCYVIIFALNFNHIKELVDIKLSEIYSSVAVQECIVCVCAVLLNFIFSNMFTSQFISTIIAGSLTVLVFFATYYIFFMKHGKFNNYVNKNV